jgi:hypothetical protein
MVERERGCRAAPEVLSSGTAALRGQMPTRMTGPKKRARPAAVGRLAPPAELAEAETKKPFIEVRSKQGRFETSTPGRRFDRRALEAALSRKGKVQTRPFSDTHAPSGARRSNPNGAAFDKRRGPKTGVLRDACDLRVERKGLELAPAAGEIGCQGLAATMAQTRRSQRRKRP